MSEIRQARLLIRDRKVNGGLVPGTALMGEPFVNLYNGVLRFSGVTGGDYEESAQSGVFEIGSTLFNSKITNRLNINDNFIISGGTGLISTYSGASGAGLSGKFMSGTTAGFVLADISDIQGTSTTVSEGNNVSINNVGDDYEVSVVGSPSFNNLTFSGTAIGGDASFAGMSATTISSGTTDLYGIFQTIGGDTDHTAVQGGTNISTGGTASTPIINLDNNIVVTSIDATTVSGGTIYSGNTDLSDLFITTDENDITRVSAGTNVSTGGTANNPIINVVDSPSFNDISFSGTATGGDASFADMSATTLYSGSTDVETIIYDIANDVAGVHTQVQGGQNIVTGGTAAVPTISLVDSPFVDVLNASGHVITNGTTYSGGTIVDDGVFVIDAATQVEIDSDLLPTAHLTYDLGAPGQRWDEVYARKVRLGTASTTLEDGLFSSTTGTFLFDFADDLHIDNNVHPNANLSYDLGENGKRWNTVFAQDLDLTGEMSVSGFTDTSLTAGRVVYVGTGGKLVDEAGFEYDDTTDTFKTRKIQIGNPGDTGTTTTIFGDILVIGESISGFTSELYIEDNLIELNYNPSASTTSTSLGAGWSIQDGSGSAGTDVLWDIRGAVTGLDNRSFSTNLHDIRVRETGTIGAPNGLRVIAESDCIDGGSY